MQEVTLDKKLSWKVWIVCALGLFIDGFDLYISSVAEPFIKRSFSPTPLTMGLIQGAAPFGAFLGAITIGYLADKLGRKKLLIANLVFFVVMALLSAFSWNTVSLIFFRFLIGFGVGADYPICAAYLSEMLPKYKVPQGIAGIMFVNCLASPIGVIVAWAIFKVHPQLDAWRYMFASGAIPALIGLMIRMHLPESFLWKAHQKLIDKYSSTRSNWYNSMQQLFDRNYFHTTIALCVPWFLMDISYYAIALFTPRILEGFQLGSYFGVNGLENSMLQILRSTLFVNSFIILGAFLSIFIVEKVDIVKLQKRGFLLAFWGLIIVALSYAETNINIKMLFIGFMIYNFFINIGPGFTTYLLPTRFYPPALRATGHGFAAGVAKSGAFVGATLLPTFQASFGICATVFFLAAALLTGYILTFLLPSDESVVFEEKMALLSEDLSL